MFPVRTQYPAALSIVGWVRTLSEIRPVTYAAVRMKGNPKIHLLPVVPFDFRKQTTYSLCVVPDVCTGAMAASDTTSTN